MNKNKELKHIAFIMDGNRRWAKKRGLPVIAGHHKGAQRIEPLVEYAAKAGISYITFWAFSSENWGRSEKEVGFIMRVFREFIKSSVVTRMMKKGVRVNIIGDLTAFPEDIVGGVSKIIEMSRDNKTITASFALNYGGRQEVLNAVNNLLNRFKNSSESVLEVCQIPNSKLQIPNKLQNSNPIKSDSNSKIQKNNNLIDEEAFSSCLFTKGLPDPDMIVRTGGEQRLSGFMPWQSVYSELYFTEILWPDFDEKEFEQAIEEYGERDRRFGK